MKSLTIALFVVLVCLALVFAGPVHRKRNTEVIVVENNGPGGHSRNRPGWGNGPMGGFGPGYGGGFGGGYGGGYGGGGGLGQVVQAAIQTKHDIQFRDVPSTGSVAPTTIDVGASSVPLNILFRSASSNLNVLQQHDGAQGSNQESSSEDEAHRLVHSVTKPIIQEVNEIIAPRRIVQQQVQPVQEEVQTLVARNVGVAGGAIGGGLVAGGLSGSLGFGN